MYTPLTLLSQPSLAFTERFVYFNGSSEEPLENFKSSRVSSLLAYRSIRTCQQKPNPSGSPFKCVKL
jgi:hypothetical protein